MKKIIFPFLLLSTSLIVAQYRPVTDEDKHIIFSSRIEALSLKLQTKEDCTTEECKNEKDRLQKKIAQLETQKKNLKITNENATTDTITENWKSEFRYHLLNGRSLRENLNNSHVYYPSIPNDPSLPEETFESFYTPENYTSSYLNKYSLLYNKVLQSSSSERNSVLKQAGDLMSFEEKITFLNHVGQKLQSRWDQRRLDATIQLKKEAFSALPCDLLLDNLNNSNSDLGICRDIMACMSSIMAKLGHDKDYFFPILYSNDSSFHTILTVVDPDNPQNIYNLSYEDQSVQKNIHGIKALMQHYFPEINSLNFRMYNWNGQLEMTLPSQLKLFLNNTMEIDNTMLYDPLVFEEYNFLSRQKNLKDNKKLNVFLTEFASGDWVGGVSLFNRKNRNVLIKNTSSILKSDRVFGISGLFRKSLRNAFHYQYVNTLNSGQSHDTGQGYINYHHILDYSHILNEKTTISAFGNFAAAGIVGVTSSKYFSKEEREELKVTGDVDLNFSLGAKINYLTLPNLDFTFKTYSGYSLGIKNLSSLTVATVSVNFLALESEFKYATKGPIKVQLSGLGVFRKYGDVFRTRTQITYDTDKWRRYVRGSYQLPLGTENILLWMPGGAGELLSVGIGEQFKSKSSYTSLSIDLFYTQRNFNGTKIHSSNVGVFVNL